MAGQGGPQTPNYKYLVLNHPQDANLKTVLAYQYPGVTLQSGYLNFDDATSSSVDIIHGQSGETTTNTFLFGDVVPTINEFNSNQAWCVISNLQIVSTNPGVGSIDITTANNTGSPQNPTFNRDADVTYTGDISASGQNTGENKLDVRQSGSNNVYM
tara:strand:- start:176 stop:646 length:471 start_codon:yes stop_codon:yes gene_type:complete